MNDIMRERLYSSIYWFDGVLLANENRGHRRVMLELGVRRYYRYLRIDTILVKDRDHF